MLIQSKYVDHFIFYRVIFLSFESLWIWKIVGYVAHERCLLFIENFVILINIDLRNNIHHKYKYKLFVVCKLYSRSGLEFLFCNDFNLTVLIV